MSLYALAGLCEDLEVSQQQEPLQVEALLNYFQQVDDAELSLVIATYYHYAWKRIVSLPQLKKWIIIHSNLPLWLINESKQAVGDLLETLSLFVAKEKANLQMRIVDIHDAIAKMEKNSEEVRLYILQTLAQLDNQSRILFLELISSAWQLPVKEYVLLDALALFFNKKSADLSIILQQTWQPFQTSLNQLVRQATNHEQWRLQPFSYYKNYYEAVPHPFDINNWLIEQKYNGIRVQIVITNNGELNIWTEDAVLIQNTFPEFAQLSVLSYSTIIDAVLCGWKLHAPITKVAIQKIIDKKSKSKQEEAFAFKLVLLDVLFYDGEDLRNTVSANRKEILRTKINASKQLKNVELAQQFSFESINALIQFVNENERTKALVLHHKLAPYYALDNLESLVLKSEKQTVYATLIYVSRANGPLFYNELTVAVYQHEELIPFAKLSNNLSKEDNETLNEYIKLNKFERLGPVTTVLAGLLIKMSYSHIQQSTTNKRGFLVMKPELIKIEWNITDMNLVYKID
jgi:DNA ligase 1